MHPHPASTKYDMQEFAARYDHWRKNFSNQELYADSVSVEIPLCCDYTRKEKFMACRLFRKRRAHARKSPFLSFYSVETLNILIYLDSNSGLRGMKFKTVLLERMCLVWLCHLLHKSGRTLAEPCSRTSATSRPCTASNAQV